MAKNHCIIGNQILNEKSQTISIIRNKTTPTRKQHSHYDAKKNILSIHMKGADERVPAFNVPFESDSKNYLK